MTEQEAYEWVRNTFNDDNSDDDTLRAAFGAVFGHAPERDEEMDMWSHLCSATPDLCGCSTRKQHETVNIQVHDEVVTCNFIVNEMGRAEMSPDDTSGVPEDILQLLDVRQPLEDIAHDVFNIWANGYDGDPENIVVTVSTCQESYRF